MEEKKYKSFLNALNWSALFIILISLTSLVVIIFYLTFNDNSPVINKVDVIYSASHQDSIQKVSFESYEKILEKKISDVNEVENIIEKKIEEVNSLYKFIGTILAIIIAVTGFFGFKSLQELKRRTLESVKEISENAAIKEFEKEKDKLRDITNSKINEAAAEQKNKLSSDFYSYKIDLDAFKNDITEVKTRYSKIEELDRLINDLKEKVRVLSSEPLNLDGQINIEQEISENQEDVDLEELEDNDEFSDN